MPVRREAFTGVSRALPEAPRPIDPPPVRDTPLPLTPALPLPPKVAPIEASGGAPVTNVPDTALIDTQIPTEKRSNWMMRGIGKVPKLFRRRDPQPLPPKP